MRAESGTAKLQVIGFTFEMTFSLLLWDLFCHKIIFLFKNFATNLIPYINLVYRYYYRQINTGTILQTSNKVNPSQMCNKKVGRRPSGKTEARNTEVLNDDPLREKRELTLKI